MTDWLTAEQDAALIGVGVPAMTLSFADRVMAALPADLPSLPIAKPARERRGLWARASIALMVTAGAGLVSMAAASTLFGVPIRNMPVVGPFVERVAPAPRPPPLAVKPHPKPARMASPSASRPAPIALPVVTETVPQQPSIINRRELRREVVAQRIADQIEQRQARRRELGLRPARLKLTPRIRERLKSMPREERRVLMQRVREVRAERRAAWAEMTPEERQALRERRAQRRQKSQDTPLP